MLHVKRYREQAEYCRKMAQRCQSPIDQQKWLKLEADWLALATDRTPAAESFDVMVQYLETGQAKSNLKH